MMSGAWCFLFLRQPLSHRLLDFLVKLHKFWEATVSFERFGFGRRGVGSSNNALMLERSA